MDPNETQESDEGVEDRYVYYAAVPSLQRITCIRILRRIWSSYISRSKNRNDLQEKCGNNLLDVFRLPDTYSEDIEEMQDLLRLPRTFKGKLMSASIAVSCGIRLWIYHLECYTKGKKNERYSIRDLVRDFDIDRCVWLPNGRIDDEQTAMKLLSTVDLSNERRFAILSEFCMKREIDQVKLRSLRKSFKKSVTFEDNPLVYYWIRYLRRDLNDIPNFPYRTVYAAVAEKCARISWTAFEYFWHRCDVEDQILVAQYLLADFYQGGYMYQERVLSMMSWFQQCRLLTLIPEKIISNFVHLNLPESTSWALKHSTLNPSNFASLVKDSFSCVRDEEKMSWLIEIWNAASPTHKSVTAHNLQYLIFPRFSRFCDSWFSPSQSAVKFLIEFLSLHDAQFREHEVLSNAVSLGVYIDNLNLVNELLELSLPSPDDRALFKRRVEESPELNEKCVYLMTDAKLADLNAKLEFYLPDSNAIQKYKQRMTSELVNEECFLYETDKWNAFSTFIDETLPDDASAALELKKNYILCQARCFPFNKVFCARDLNPMIQIVESVFNTENENENIKNVFFDSFVAMLKQNDYQWYKIFFKEMYFRRFVRWCLGEEDPAAVLKYNCGAFIQDVVAGVLGAINNCYVAKGEFKEALLHDLDRCLMWYLSDEERVKEYKLEWIKLIHDLDIVQSVAQRNDTVSLETLCIWFFDEDQDAIQQFKSKRVKLQSS